MQIKPFTEADIKAVGGLSERERYQRGLPELMQLAVTAVPKFREALNNGQGIRRWWRAVQQACGALREANSEAALGFLLRKGVQTTANDWYNVAPREWQKYCRTESSSTIAEFYAPLYPSVIPDRVQRGTPFPEGGIQGESSTLVNQKFGAIESFERELFDDDQTGQVRQRAQRLGQGMAVTESIWTSSRFVGAARTYANITVPVSTYSTTDYSGATVSVPWSSTLFSATAGNRPSTYHVLNMCFLKQAYTTLLNATDPLSNKIIVNPDCLLVAADDAVNAQLLLAPGAYPAVVGQSNTAVANAPILGGATSAAGASQGVTAGFPGGWGSANPFAGIGIKLVVERYLPAWTSAFGEAGKGFVFQQRDPLEVVQQDPASGAAFNTDTYRFRSRERFEADWIAGGSRFWFLINDGSVTSGNQ